MEGKGVTPFQRSRRINDLAIKKWDPNLEQVRLSRTGSGGLCVGLSKEGWLRVRVRGPLERTEGLKLKRVSGTGRDGHRSC